MQGCRFLPMSFCICVKDSLGYISKNVVAVSFNAARIAAFFTLSAMQEGSHLLWHFFNCSLSHHLNSHFTRFFLSSNVQLPAFRRKWGSKLQNPTCELRTCTGAKVAGVEWERRTVTGNEVREVRGTTASGAPWVSIGALRLALSLLNRHMQLYEGSAEGATCGGRSTPLHTDNGQCVDSYEYFQSWSPFLKKDSLCDPFGPQSPIALAQVKVDFAWDYILSQLFPFLHSASLSSRLHQELDFQHITFTRIFSGSAFREPKPLTSQSL